MESAFLFSKELRTKRVKGMYYLKKWRLQSIYSGVIAWGIVKGHNRLEDGENIHTSRITSLENDEANKRILMRTCSGSHYELKWCDINRLFLEEIMVILAHFQISGELAVHCEKAYKEEREKKLIKMSKILEPKELFLEILGAKVLGAFYKDEYGVADEIPVCVYEDEIEELTLITDFKYGKVDFRFSNKSSFISLDYWEDELQTLKIFNTGRNPIHMFGRGYDVICTAGKVTRIKNCLKEKKV